MKSIATQILLLMLMASHSFASPSPQSKEQQQLILGILLDMKYVENIEAGMKMQMKKTLKENPSLPQKLVIKMKARLDKKVILDELVRSWGTEYTVEDLKEIRKFLKTKAGFKFLQRQPSITERMSGVGAMIGMDMYKILHDFDPIRYPMDATALENLERYRTLRNKGK